LNSNSAAALAGFFRTVVVKAAEAAQSKPLRVIFIVCYLPERIGAPGSQFPPKRQRPQDPRATPMVVRHRDFSDFRLFRPMKPF
jgi:hypothetical protein